MERAGEEWGVHGWVITALDTALAPTARNSDYPTAPQPCSDTGNVHEAILDPEVAQEPGPRWLLLLWSANPSFLSFQGLANPGLENATSNIPKLILEVNLGLGCVCCGFLCWESWLVQWYYMNHL